jgi:hypothetical protein
MSARGMIPAPYLTRRSRSLFRLGAKFLQNVCLLDLALKGVNCGRRAVKHGNRVAPILAVAIHIGHPGRAGGPRECEFGGKSGN